MKMQEKTRVFACFQWLSFQRCRSMFPNATRLLVSWHLSPSTPSYHSIPISVDSFTACFKLSLANIYAMLYVPQSSSSSPFKHCSNISQRKCPGTHFRLLLHKKPPPEHESEHDTQHVHNVRLHSYSVKFLK